jgi:hypothetical protein
MLFSVADIISFVSQGVAPKRGFGFRFAKKNRFVCQVTKSKLGNVLPLEEAKVETRLL